MQVILKSSIEDEVPYDNTSGTTVRTNLGGLLEPLTENKKYYGVRNLPVDENTPREVLPRGSIFVESREDEELSIIPSQTFFRESWEREPFVYATERFLRINRIVDSIDDDAEFQLQSNPYLTEAVDRILEEIMTIIKQKNIDISISLDVFYDNEVSDWSTFSIVVKPKTTEVEIENLLKVWDELSQKTEETLQSLSEKSETYRANIMTIRDNIIVSVEVD